MAPKRSKRGGGKAAEPDYLRLEDQVCFPIYVASRLVVNAYRPLLEALDLTYPQYLVMLVLWQTDGLNVGEIGERLYLETGTLTPLLKRMEKQGLVSRKRRGSDDRIVENWLTETGRETKAQANHIPVQMLCNAQLELSDALALKGAVERLVQNLLQLEGEPEKAAPEPVKARAPRR